MIEILIGEPVIAIGKDFFRKLIQLKRSACVHSKEFITSQLAKRKTLQLVRRKICPNDVCKSSVENSDTFTLAAGFGFWFIGKRQGSLITSIMMNHE